MLIVDILVDSKWNLSNHTCWLQCVMCLFQATLHASSCTAALMLVFVVKLAHVDQAPVLRMRGWVGSTFNLHRAGSYCTFSTLVKVYPHKTFFTRGSKKALQKPVLRGEWSRGGGAAAAASIWRIEQAISHQPCLIITNRTADAESEMKSMSAFQGLRK